MFYEPIRYVPFASLEELKENSIQMFVSCLGSPKQYTHYQDSIVYIDGRSQTFVTPLRRETPKILEDNGYKEGEYFIRSADKEYIDKLRFAVDGEEYLAGAYMSSGSSSASIQSAAASGFGGTELIINEDGILDQMLDVYQTYSGLVASAV